MKGFLSHYRPRYLRSLVYMLQASEYDVDEFLRWYHRTWDFSNVEKRGRLKYTSKAIVCAGIAWFFAVLFFAIIVLGLDPASGDIPHMVGLLLIIIAPFLVPYLLAFSVRILNFLQRPFEARIVARAEQKLAGHTGSKIAIAGSYGKTSMREILKTVLSEGLPAQAGKKVAAPPGSYNTPLGIAKFVETLSGDEDVLIFELGEYYPGDVRKLCEFIRPDLGVITGINEAHLEKFGTLERTADTIFELAAFVAPDALYINGENDRVRANAKAGNVVYSRTGAGRFTVTDSKSDLNGTSLTLVSGNERLPVGTDLLGLHHVGPLAVAAEIAARLGLSIAQIVAGIEKTKPFAHRLERRTDTSGVVTLDDSYNGNPDGVAAVIEFLAALKGHLPAQAGRRFYVTPGLVETGPRKEVVHRNIGHQLANAGIERVVLIKNSVTPLIEQGLKESKYAGEVIWFDDMPMALTALQHSTVSGDVVLIQNDWPDQYA